MIKDAMILSKVEGWLEDEVLDYQEHADDIGDVDSFDDGILEEDMSVLKVCRT